MAQESRTLSIRGAASEFGISRTVLSAAIHAGALPAYQPTARTVRVFRSDVELWIRRSAVRPTDFAAARVEEVLAREAKAAGGAD